jgi:hypothetical protein
MALNAAWHAKHPMPKPATLAQRAKWHVTHAKACGCRPMPAYAREASNGGSRHSRGEGGPRTVLAKLERRKKPAR